MSYIKHDKLLYYRNMYIYIENYVSNFFLTWRVSYNLQKVVSKDGKKAKKTYTIQEMLNITNSMVGYS